MARFWGITLSFWLFATGCSYVLRAFNWAPLNFHPVNACIHLFVNQATHQHQVSSNYEDSHRLKFVFCVAFYRLYRALLGGCEDEVGLVVDGSQDALVGTAIYGDDSDDIFGFLCQLGKK